MVGQQACKDLVGVGGLADLKIFGERNSLFVVGGFELLGVCEVEHPFGALARGEGLA